MTLDQPATLQEDESWYEPLDKPRLSDRVADEILKSIFVRGLQPGDRLPTEQQFCEQFGVSRTVVREATRSLQARGIISSGPGRGLRVIAVEAASVSESMTLFMRGRPDLTYDKVSEVRAMMEVHIAGLAAERATLADIAGLSAAADRLERSLGTDTELGADVEFHRLLVETTHNALYTLILDVIADILVESRRLSLASDPSERVGMGGHRLILDAVAAHDAMRAREAMRAHLEVADRVYRRGLSLSTEHP